MMPAPDIPGDWNDAECWVWERIAAGEVADLNAGEFGTSRNDPLDPRKEDGWGQERYLRAKFFQTILTQKAFVDATPYSGVRVLGAIVVDGPLDLQSAKLPRQFWLEKCRILTELSWQELRVDGQLSLEGSVVAADVTLSEARIIGSASFMGGIFTKDVYLNGATVEGSAYLCDGATFKGMLDLTSAKIGTGLKMGGSTFEKDVSLNSAKVAGAALLRGGAVFKGGLDLTGAKIGAGLEMDGGTFEKDVSLNSADVAGAAHLGGGATFKGRLDMISTKIGASLEMVGGTFEKDVSLNGATVEGAAILRSDADLCRNTRFLCTLDFAGANVGLVLDMNGSVFEDDVSLNGCTVAGAAHLGDGATFNGGLDLTGARIGATLDMDGSKFEKDVSLNGATVESVAILRGHATFKGRLDLTGANLGALDMDGSTFEKDVSLNSATVQGSVFLRGGAKFRGMLDLKAEKIGANLEMIGSFFESAVDLTGCAVTGGVLLGRAERSSAAWGDSASLTLHNTHVGMFQDWWLNKSSNAWPKKYMLEGFTYERLGWGSVEKEGDMLGRSVGCYIDWLTGDPGSSPQPYEHLASRFHEAGETDKSNRVLYAARELQRRKAWSKVDDYGQPKRREWSRALGLYALRLTIGYGLGTRYFRVLWWVLGLTLLGAFLLIFVGTVPLQGWPQALFASLDQLLPIVTLDKAHDALILGQCYNLLIYYFYAHKIAGWVLGSFLVAGLGGLTQRN